MRSGPTSLHSGVPGCGSGLPRCTGCTVILKELEVVLHGLLLVVQGIVPEADLGIQWIVAVDVGGMVLDDLVEEAHGLVMVAFLQENAAEANCSLKTGQGPVCTPMYKYDQRYIRDTDRRIV